MGTGESKISRNQVLGAGAIVVVLYTWVLLPEGLLPEGFISWAVNEDGLIEWLGALSLLVASGFFFVAFVRARRAGWERPKQLFLVGMAAVLFVGAGEELNWGQRILDYETPKPFEEANYQRQPNLHNLEVAGDFGVWRAFELLTLLFAVALPLAAWRNPGVRARASRYVPIVPLAVAALFVLAELFALASAYVYSNHWEKFDVYPGDVLGGGDIWAGTGTSETAFSVIWAVVGLSMLRLLPARSAGSVSGTASVPAGAAD